MRYAALLVIPAAFAWACGGDDSTVPDASPDVTVDNEVPDVVDAAVDVYVDAPPERAIWVSTTTTLFKFDPVTRVLTRVADFDCSDEPMIDLAMNAKEELFGITSESVMRIDKTTGVCTPIARGALNLPYATGFVPAENLEAGVETWFGYKYATYSSIDPDSGALTFAGALGGKAGNFQASGDMVSLSGGKTYLTGFDFDPQAGDGILELDPATGASTVLDGVTGITSLAGLAQWQGILYAFSETGSIFRVKIIAEAGVTVQPLGIIYDFGDAGSDADADPSDAASDAPIEAAPPLKLSFRGAAVTTRAPTQ